MSFASEVKKELTQLEVHHQHARAELAALVRMNGTLIYSEGHLTLNIQTENAAIAKRIYILLKEHYHIIGELIVRRKMKLKKNNVYIVKVKHKLQNLLEHLQIIENGLITSEISKDICNDEQLMRSYLRGAFLAGGSVNTPNRSSYHLEIYSHDDVHNQGICEMMNFFQLHARVINRRQGWISYIKEAEKISDFFAVIGANQALLRYEDVRIVRELRNNVNRVVNCENANMNRTIDASSKQINNINIIDDYLGLDELPEKLKEVALARLENPDASLVELGNLIPSGKISKSAVNHRLRKINTLAEKLVNNEFKSIERR